MNRYRNYRSNDGSGVTVVVVLGIIVLVLTLIFSPISCTEAPETTRLLQQQGYKNITITGYRHFMKGEGDWYSTGFEATAPNGDKVSGAVTGGLLKGRTVRFD